MQNVYLTKLCDGSWVLWDEYHYYNNKTAIARTLDMCNSFDSAVNEILTSDIKHYLDDLYDSDWDVFDYNMDSKCSVEDIFDEAFNR